MLSVLQIHNYVFNKIPCNCTFGILGILIKSKYLETKTHFMLNIKRCGLCINSTPNKV